MEKNKQKTLQTAKSFDAVYDGKAKILMMGTIPSAGGVKYGFFYMSKVNYFWHYLTQTLKTDNFVELANAYRDAYNTPQAEECKQNVKQALYKNHIALYDVINTCERVGSADNEIVSSINNSAQSIFQIIKDNPSIKMIFVNSYEVEKRLKQILGEDGIKQLQQMMNIDTLPYTRILSPSPFCRFTYTEDQILDNWKIIKNYL